MIALKGTFGEPEQPERLEKPEQPVTTSEIISIDTKFKRTTYGLLYHHFFLFIECVSYCL